MAQIQELTAGKQEQVQRFLENAYNVIVTVIGYMLLPMSNPCLFYQEVRSFIRETFGLNKRTLEGKVVLITGASSGIGEGLAKVFYLAGTKLILVSRRSGELERVKNELLRLRTKPDARVYVPAILSIDLEEFDTIPDKCKQALDIYGQVDILINNGGISNRGSILDTEFHVQQKVMNVNYFGSVAMTKSLLPQMIERRNGTIVFISSVQGKFAVPFRSAYSASKHAVQAFADCLRAEVKESGISVTVVSPGYVRTNISYNALAGSGEQHGKLDSTTAAGYTPEFVAERTYKALLNREKDVVIASFVHRLAIWIHKLCSNFFSFLMVKRAQHAKNE